MTFVSRGDICVSYHTVQDEFEARGLVKDLMTIVVLEPGMHVCSVNAEGGVRQAEFRCDVPRLRLCLSRGL